jgi:ADP-ribose pyrophosphatase YjhB (NUDIX family)
MTERPADGKRPNVLPLLDELQIIARNGLTYAGDPHDAYDEERYERVLHLVSEWYGRSLDLPPAEVRERLTAEEVGHVTPKVGATAAVFDGEGRVLVMRHPNDDAWRLPGGMSESGEEPEETVVRETREEVGVEVGVAELVDADYFEPAAYGPHGGVTLLYRCVPMSGEPGPSREADAARYARLEDVPAWFDERHERYARMAGTTRS